MGPALQPGSDSSTLQPMCTTCCDKEGCQVSEWWAVSNPGTWVCGVEASQGSGRKDSVGLEDKRGSNLRAS